MIAEKEERLASFIEFCFDPTEGLPQQFKHLVIELITHAMEDLHRSQKIHNVVEGSSEFCQALCKRLMNPN